MAFQAVLFDVDGTLLNTHEFIFQAYEATLKTYTGAVVPRTELVRHIAGAPLEVCYQQLAPNYNIDHLCAAHRQFQTENMHLLAAFPTAIDVMQALRIHGLKTGVVTTRRVTGRQSLEQTALAPLLDVIVTGDDVEHYKPHPEGIERALTLLNVQPEQAIMVGDSAADIEAGQRAGTTTVAVTYGFTSSDLLTLLEPDHLIQDLSDLIAIATDV